MMKRLLEDADQASTFGGSLLQAAEVVSPDPRRKRANWVALQSKRRPRAWLWRPALVTCFLASTALASTLLPRLFSHAPATPSAKSMRVIAPAAPAVVLPAPKEAPTPAPPVVVPSPAAIHKQAKATAQAELVRKADADDEVLAAIRLLRAGKDPELASALAELYLHRHPDGVLAEEALAVLSRSYEGRAPGKAVRLAKLYLQRFPHGAYAASMQRLVGSSP
ncbi:MAG: hypothetical protein SF187_01440 [Deltaproteobacteria bacterium]|nr:hypothetical protein [Deltaproteobacteria bacterium]